MLNDVPAKDIVELGDNNVEMVLNYSFLQVGFQLQPYAKPVLTCSYYDVIHEWTTEHHFLRAII